MVEIKSLSELWLGGEAGSVTQFLSQFSNLHMVANEVHPRLFSRLLPLVSVFGGKQGNCSMSLL